LKQICLGTTSFGGTKNWEALPPNAPRGYGPDAEESVNVRRPRASKSEGTQRVKLIVPKILHCYRST